MEERVYHTFPPVWDASSRLLILGSFPSVRSREEGFYYGHPRNRFWPLLAALTQEPVPTDIPPKKDLLLRHGIALWDVAESCRIIGSSDSSIRDITPVPIREVLGGADIQAVFANGSTAWALYMEYLYPVTQMEAVKLPSTSPANAAVSADRLLQRWHDALAPYLSF